MKRSRLLYQAGLIVSVFVCTFLLFASEKAFAAPALSSVSGTWNHKATITINGSGFGTKATAAPVVWDDASGANILDKWDGVWPNSTVPSIMTTYRTPMRGVSLPHNNITKYIAGCVAGGAADTGNNADMFKNRTIGSFPAYSYVSWYHRADPAWSFSGSEHNYKLFDYSIGTEPMGPDNWYFEYNPPPLNSTPTGSDVFNDPNYHINNNGGAGVTPTWGDYAYKPMNGWVKIELEIRYDRNSTGYVRGWENGALKFSYNGTTDAISGNSRTETVGGFTMPRGSTQWEYFADVYLDYTRQRIVLANNSNINNATIKEVQIPSAWNDTSITLSSNLGKFTSGQTAYLFVYDSTGTPNSTGYPVTIGSGSGGGDTTPPTLPSNFNLAANATSQSSITVSWNPATDDVGVSNYQVERCTGLSCSTFAQVGTPTASPFVDTGLSASTGYSYHVRAVDAAGNTSGWSNVVGATTQAPDTQAPTAPSSLTASTSSSSTIDLTWTASTDNVGVTGYKVERCSGSSCTTFSQIATPTTNSYQDTSLNSGTTYRYQVRATDGGGNNSSYSNIASATTQTAPITLGETSILPSGDSGNGNLLLAQQATLSQPGTLQSLSFYVTTASGNLRLGVYDATGPSGGPGTLKAQTNSFTPTTGWNTQNVTTPIALTTGTYWLAYLPSSSSLAFVRDGTGSFKYYSYTFGSLPTTFSTTPSSGTDHWSFYATFSQPANTTPQACSTVTPTNFTDPTFTGYGAPHDVFASNTPLISTQCSSTDTHTLTATLGIPGDTTRIVYTKGYYYDPGINDWTSFTGTCTGALNGEWCQGSVAISITDTDISTASVSDPSYLVGFTCRSQNGSWKCGCRDTSCSNFYWQVQGAGM